MAAADTKTPVTCFTGFLGASYIVHLAPMVY